MMLAAALPRLSRSVAAGLILAMSAGTLALAQAGSRVCSQLEAQLRSAGGGNVRLAQQQQAEINKTQAYANAIGCNGFFKPGECYGLQQRIGQMQANLAQLSGAGQRNAILAALEANGCRGARQPQTVRQIPYGDEGGHLVRPQSAYPVPDSPRQRGFFETLFGGGRGMPSDEYSPMLDEQPQILDEDRQRFGGARLVCVKTCDGSFYPLNSTGGSRDPEDWQDLCALQCPGAEVQLFRMGSDGDIANASSFEGDSYMALANALVFRRRFEKSCSCRPQNATWFEAMSGRDDPTVRSGDVIVSPEQARLMSLPAAQRAAENERLRAETAKRREADRLQRAERRKARQNTAVGLDGVTRPLESNEPMRGVSEPQPVAPPEPEPAPDDMPRPNGIIRVIPTPSTQPRG